jgi:hypothetical protein
MPTTRLFCKLNRPNPWTRSTDTPRPRLEIRLAAKRDLPPRGSTGTTVVMARASAS